MSLVVLPKGWTYRMLFYAEGGSGKTCPCSTPAGTVVKIFIPSVAAAAPWQHKMLDRHAWARKSSTGYTCIRYQEKLWSHAVLKKLLTCGEKVECHSCIAMLTGPAPLNSLVDRQRALFCRNTITLFLSTSPPPLRAGSFHRYPHPSCCCCFPSARSFLCFDNTFPTISVRSETTGHLSSFIVVDISGIL